MSQLLNHGSRKGKGGVGPDKKCSRPCIGNGMFDFYSPSISFILFFDEGSFFTFIFHGGKQVERRRRYPE